jgi:hypothetical protein
MASPNTLKMREQFMTALPDGRRVERHKVCLVQKNPEPDQPTRQAKWNYEPCEAQTGTVVVGKTNAPLGWSRGLEGTRRRCVRVNYKGDVFWLDDEDGSGSRKVFRRGGGPDTGHKSLPVDDPGTFEAELPKLLEPNSEREGK